jgi:hypothetical protein
MSFSRLDYFDFINLQFQHSWIQHIELYQYTISSSRIYAYTISFSRIHDINFIKSTSWINNFNLMYSRFHFHEFTTSRFSLFNFVSSRIETSWTRIHGFEDYVMSFTYSRFSNQSPRFTFNFITLTHYPRLYKMPVCLLLFYIKGFIVTIFRSLFKKTCVEAGVL